MLKWFFLRISPAELSARHTPLLFFQIFAFNDERGECLFKVFAFEVRISVNAGAIPMTRKRNKK